MFVSVLQYIRPDLFEDEVKVFSHDLEFDVGDAGTVGFFRGVAVGARPECRYDSCRPDFLKKHDRNIHCL